jgi:hypothetical protein
MKGDAGSVYPAALWISSMKTVLVKLADAKQGIPCAGSELHAQFYKVRFDWAYVCHAVQAAEELGDKITIYKEHGRSQDLASQLQIHALPALVFIGGCNQASTPLRAFASSQHQGRYSE